MLFTSKKWFLPWTPAAAVWSFPPQCQPGPVRSVPLRPFPAGLAARQPACRTPELSQQRLRSGPTWLGRARSAGEQGKEIKPLWLDETSFTFTKQCCIQITTIIIIIIICPPSPCQPGGSEPLSPSWEPGDQGRSLLAAAWRCSLKSDPPALTWGWSNVSKSPLGRRPEMPGNLHRVRLGWGSPVHHQGRQGVRRHHEHETGPRRRPVAGTPGWSSTARSEVERWTEDKRHNRR